MPRSDRAFSATKLAYLDMLITAAQENGASLGDRIAGAGKDPVVCEAHKPFDLSREDLAILAEVSRLYERLEWSPTLDELVEVRGRMLNERRAEPEQEGAPADVAVPVDGGAGADAGAAAD